MKIILTSISILVCSVFTGYLIAQAEVKMTAEVKQSELRTCIEKCGYKL